MSTRLNLKIINKSNEAIICRKILCQDIGGLDVGDQLTVGGGGSYQISTNDRVFCSWQGMISGTEYQLAMICPKSSSNSAAGYGSAGLQEYSGSGTPVTITFHIGNKDLADWDNGDKYTGCAPDFGDCS
jgi:hypothetical protein